MEKVLITVSDNNKGKFIAKGFSSAFQNLSYFVYERKICDLELQEALHIKPHIVFIFWTDISQIDKVKEFVSNYKEAANETVFVHCAELKKDIPNEYKKLKNHYIFAEDSRNKYLPSVNAADYKTKFSKYNFGITFAGNPAVANREETLAALIMNFGEINIFCRSYDFYKSLEEISQKNLLDEYFIELYKSSYKGCVNSTAELSNIYASTKINIDMIDCESKYLNYRCLEIMASDGFLIAPYNKKIVKYFDDGKDLETYLTNTELVDKVSFYMKNLNLSRLIAANGRKNTVSNHSFCDRLKLMLEVIYGKNTGNR